MVSFATQKYVPSMYAARRPAAAEIAGMYIKAWEQKHFASKPKADLKTELYPAICFSRKIGVGALEIADILAKKIGSRVADKLIIEEMANNSSVKKETVDFFDERYPGRVAELATLLFGEKSFIMSNYMHGLMGVLYALAMSEPTIFVGRAAYLLLPRDRALSVRFICSKPYRAKRIAKIMKISANEAEKKLQELDKEQSDFFKKLAGKKEPVPEDFDLLINCDVISRPEWAADIVAAAFRSKFGV